MLHDVTTDGTYDVTADGTYAYVCKMCMHVYVYVSLVSEGS